MKTKEELNALKEEVETLNKKLAELTEEEQKQVTGGQTEFGVEFVIKDPNLEKEFHLYKNTISDSIKREFEDKI